MKKSCINLTVLTELLRRFDKAEEITKDPAFLVGHLSGQLSIIYTINSYMDLEAGEALDKELVNRLLKSQGEDEDLLAQVYENFECSSRREVLLLNKTSPVLTVTDTVLTRMGEDMGSWDVSKETVH